VALSQTPYSKAETKREIPPLIAKGRDVTLVCVHENFVKGILDRIGRELTVFNARLRNITLIQVLNSDNVLPTPTNTQAVSCYYNC
jgi:hypothetical protein